MAKYTWTINALKQELGICFNDLRRLIFLHHIIPENWEDLPEQTKIKHLAEKNLLLPATEIKALISKMLSTFFSYNDIIQKIEENTQLNYDILSEIKQIHKDFDLSMEPMSLKDIAIELSVSVKTLHNYKIKEKYGTAMLPYPKKNPIYNFPLYWQGGQWNCNRFEFLRQRRSLGYDSFKKLEIHSKNNM